ELAGAILYPDDRSGDAHLFCQDLYRMLQDKGVAFHFGASVESIVVRDNTATGVLTQEGELAADHIVIAAGSYVTPLLRAIGIKAPVQPVKGYSITVPMPVGPHSLSTPIVDDHLHAVVTPLTDAIRVAGTAEFAGFDLSLSPKRISNLRALLGSVMPNLRFDERDVRPWCGLRPMSSDGVPIIGHAGLRNLWINTGHGHLGWTMAAGSGRLLAELLTGQPPSINPAPYALDRFS
ncbi:MAG TPA: FAD-dependent oxidoreductase, partial [Verrucomicrobiae bacterium]|nr:FAD-dependent oxidoreductase [Verrucomicrobiae bacterium]